MNITALIVVGYVFTTVIKINKDTNPSGVFGEALGFVFYYEWTTEWIMIQELAQEL